MTGTIINAAAIIGGGLVGLLLRKGIPERINVTIQHAMGLLVLIIGIQYTFNVQNLAVIGVSLVLGAIWGEWQDWEEKLQLLGNKLQNKFSSNDNHFVKGFVSASLLFCVGAMAVVGALEDGLTGNYEILLVKSLLDGVFSIIFTASMGIGVIFSALPVLFYQGGISLASGIIKPFLTDPMLNNITALGGLLIAGLGLNILQITHIRVANLLPGIIMVPLVMSIISMLSF